MAPYTMLNPDNYVEKPRPNFYNVIKKIRESKVKVLFHAENSNRLPTREFSTWLN